MFQHQKVPDTEVEDIIQNDGFWPDISLSDFVRTCRIPPVYNQEQIRNMLILAITGVNIELESFKQRSMTNGIQSAQRVGAVLEGDSTANIQYKQAVYQRAKACLLVHFATLSRKDEAENLAKESDETRDALMALSQQAIRNIIGIPMATIRLL
ncbi:head completion/stabilization protein [Photobacterium damselae]|uniref:head completion/stabilization protein n=1 Tax=Photobacterium damselae TaxID=38293 RepID=UPI002F3FA8CB